MDLTGAVHQVLAGSAPRDAITGHALAARDLFRSWGLRSEIVSGGIHPELAGTIHDARAYPRIADPNDLAILHYSIESPAFAIAAQHSRRTAIHYHNITPAHLLWEHAAPVAIECAVGRRRLVDYADRVVVSCADSAFNARELADIGFRDPTVTGILCRPVPLPASLPARPLGPLRLLFVGRGIPNKAQHHLILALAALHEAGREAELTLIGSWGAAMGYLAECRALADALGVGDRVVIPDSVDERRLGLEYRFADIFVCLSDHEGFCVPLIEAMAADLPIVAYDAGAVSETLGSCGLLLTDKHPGVVAEAVMEVADNPALRAHFTASRSRRLAELGQEAVSERLRTFIEAAKA